MDREINRYITRYNKRSDLYIGGIPIGQISLQDLLEIFTPYQGDPELIMVHDIKPKHVENLQRLLKTNFKFDFSTYDYCLECFSDDSSPLTD